jgi:hypothetical protein
MKPNDAFLKQPKSFWAYVRSISQEVGYTVRAKGATESKIRVPSISEICSALDALELDRRAALQSYFAYRAAALNDEMPKQLMNAEQAKAAYELLLGQGTDWVCPFPMNKQKGVKKAPAYLTCMVNMIVATAIGELSSCDFDPRTLTTITVNKFAVRTLARRVDGAFPQVVNPRAIWEVKEYYYTTSFGSRIADGVYETMLDGMELEEQRESENINVKHYLMIDGYHTWWIDGKSYLCRIVDMLHMGYVDEVLAGREVPSLLPGIVKGWLDELS